MTRTRSPSPCSARLPAWLLAVGLLLFAAPRTVRAEVINLPVGGRSVPASPDLVICPVPAAPFTADPGARLVRAPIGEDAIGARLELDLAPTLAGCEGDVKHVTLVAIGANPQPEPSSLVFSVDEGRVDARGRLLAGSVLFWESGAESGSDVCRDAVVAEGVEHCAWALPRGLSVDPTVTRFRLLPRGSLPGPESVFYDALGRKIAPESFTVLPARTVLSRLVPPEAAVDLSASEGVLPLTHPEAVSAAECSVVSCEVSGGRVVVRAANAVVGHVEARLRLAPHVVLARKEQVETHVTVKLPVMRCPMTIVSGAPIRGNDDAKTIVRLDGRCASDVGQLKFASQFGPVRVASTVRADDSGYAVLRLGRFEDDHLTISALRGETDQVAVAVASAPTRVAPSVRATLELPNYPNVGFIPNNRNAAVHVNPAGDKQRFAVLPVEGVYEVMEDSPPRPAEVRASEHAAGLTPLRFGVRTTNLPAGLDRVDLAIVYDPLQRDTIQANLPAPIEPTHDRPDPLVEVLCGGGNQPLHRIAMGDTAHLSFDLRDACRVVFHRERLGAEYGTQKIRFEVEIVRSDGSSRAEGRVSETITLRRGKNPRSAWVSGVMDPFDRVIVRVFHVADEAHYIGASEIKTGSPAGQWSMIMGTGRVRLYGTTTIPTGLYRFTPKSAYSGVLSLNFGVISRLTWLDEEGKEGILGAEAGMLVLGLANSTNAAGNSLTQVAAVVGAGIAVPIANRSRVTQASINVHAWLEIALAGAEAEKSRYAMVFGPSITIGNVGANL